MKVTKESMLLYVVTDRAWIGRNSLVEQVEESIKNGATFVQIREKELAFEKYVEESLKIKSITDRYSIPFVVNDNVDVALAVDADGVHVGQKDMLATDVRALIGENKILGVSVQTVEQAILAQEQGADYLGVGTIFTTNTKKDADNVSLTTLNKICLAVSIPVVAIGGITKENICEFQEIGIDGVAVVSAIFSKDDIGKATKDILKLLKNIVKN